MEGLFSEDFVCAYALHRHHASMDLGQQRVAVVGIEPANVAHLSACIGVKRRVIQDDLALFSRRNLSDSRSVANDRQDF
jgi:hypothetical protein